MGSSRLKTRIQDLLGSDRHRTPAGTGLAVHRPQRKADVAPAQIAKAAERLQVARYADVAAEKLIRPAERELGSDPLQGDCDVPKLEQIFGLNQKFDRRSATATMTADIAPPCCNAVRQPSGHFIQAS